jgi:phage head maturation protease
MSSTRTNRRPTLPFTTIFGVFLIHESSPLYQCLASAGLPDKNKQAALAYLFHLGCFNVDVKGEISFRDNIASHGKSLSSKFPAALQLIELHNEHVVNSSTELRTKNRLKTARCRERKRKIKELSDSQVIDFPLVPEAASSSQERTKKVQAKRTKKVELHNEHVVNSSTELRTKNRLKTARCRERKRKIKELSDSQVIDFPLVPEAASSSQERTKKVQVQRTKKVQAKPSTFCAAAAVLLALKHKAPSALGQQNGGH